MFEGGQTMYRAAEEKKLEGFSFFVVGKHGALTDLHFFSFVSIS